MAESDRVSTGNAQVADDNRLRCPNDHELSPGLDMASARWCPQCGSPLIVDLRHTAQTDAGRRQGSPVFEDAVFISFAHLDNQPAGPTKARWIDEFREHLAIRLAELFGDQVSVFQDEELRGNDDFKGVLSARLEKVATLVSICSPRYAKSTWCQWEVSQFAAFDPPGAQNIPPNKSRVFKAMKTPVPHETLPAPLPDLVGYDFFEKSEVDSRMREYLRNPLEAERWKFYARVDDVAEDLAELLVELGYNSDDLSLVADEERPTVFLAETATDLAEARDDIRRELERRGHRVLPERPLPLDIDELPAALDSVLQQADFALHPLGERYGPRPDGDDRSMPQLQFEAALESAEHGELVQLVWIADQGQEPAPAQAALIEKVQSLDVDTNTEVIRAPLRAFKAHAVDRMAPRAQSTSRAPATDSQRIYLIHHPVDATAAATVRTGLEALGFMVETPLTSGTAAECREIHESSLVLCDAVMIFQGNASDHWLRLMQFDLIKAAGWGRNGPFVAQGIWLAEPATSTKAEYSSNEALVLNATVDQASALLKTFAAAVGSVPENE